MSKDHDPLPGWLLAHQLAVELMHEQQASGADVGALALFIEKLRGQISSQRGGSVRQSFEIPGARR